MTCCQHARLIVLKASHTLSRLIKQTAFWIHDSEGRLELSPLDLQLRKIAAWIVHAKLEVRRPAYGSQQPPFVMFCNLAENIARADVILTEATCTNSPSSFRPSSPVHRTSAITVGACRATAC